LPGVGNNGGFRSERPGSDLFWASGRMNVIMIVLESLMAGFWSQWLDSGHSGWALVIVAGIWPKVARIRSSAVGSGQSGRIWVQWRGSGHNGRVMVIVAGFWS
jgi:hypothetical protein